MNTNFNYLYCKDAKQFIVQGDCLDELKNMFDTLSKMGFESAAEDTQKVYFNVLAARNQYLETVRVLDEQINNISEVWRKVEFYHNNDSSIEGVQQVITQYEANKPKEAPFHPLNIYKDIVKKHVPTQQQNMITMWYRTAPHDLLKEALKRVEQDCPQNPFGLLKHLMNKWLDAGYQTLSDILEGDEQYRSSRPTKQQKKASDKDVEIRRSYEEKGHYKGIPAMDW